MSRRRKRKRLNYLKVKLDIKVTEVKAESRRFEHKDGHPSEALDEH